MPTIFPEGQIPVPKSVRNFWSIVPGDEVDFQIAGDRVFIFKKVKRKRPFRSYLGYLSNLHGINSDEIIKELRGQIDDIGTTNKNHQSRTYFPHPFLLSKAIFFGRFFLKNHRRF